MRKCTEVQAEVQRFSQRGGNPVLRSLYGELVLTNLFGLHSSSILTAEAQLSDGHVVKDDVEVFGSFIQLPPHQQRHLSDNNTTIFHFDFFVHNFQDNQIKCWNF